MIRRLLSIDILRQFIKYGTVGVINVAAYLAIFNVLRVLEVPTIMASVVAFAVTSVGSFILNKRWTFRDVRTDVVRQYVLFVTFTLVGLGLHTGALAMLLVPLERYGRIGENAAALGAMPVSVAWNFTTYRKWTFTEHRSSGRFSPVADA